MRPELITFDCYGTLIDWERGITDAFAGEAKRVGRPVDAAAVLRAYHDAEREIEAGEFRPYRQVLHDVARAATERLGWSLPAGDAAFLVDSLPTWPPFPDTNPALERLNADGYRLGIVSNIDDDLLADTLQHFTVAFDLIVTAQQIDSYKPAPEHFRRALDAVDGDSDRIVHVAQSYYHDVRPARELGIRVVWVNRGGEAKPDGPAPNAEVRDLAAAADKIAALGQG